MRTSLLLIAVLFVSGSLFAQVGVTFSPNIASQPIWGPTGYDHVEYYYLPDIETYYDVPQKKFFSYEGGHWISTAKLPSRHHGYDFYNSYKVVVNEQKPFHNHNRYKDQYASFKGRHGQTLIRDSRDSRYYVIVGHPEHAKWVKQNGSANGKGKNNKE